MTKLKRYSLIAAALLVLAAVIPANAGTLKPLGEVFGLRGPAPTQADVPLLVQAFEEMAFNDEAGRRTDFVIRWNSRQISVWISPDLRSQHETRIRQALGLAGSIAGIHFTVVDTEARAQIKYLRTDAPILTDACMVSSTVWINGPQNGTLVAESIYFHRRMSFPNAEICPYEEILNGLGLFADTDLLDASMFRTTTERKHSTPWLGDAVLFRALYDQRLRPGMSRQDAMRVVPKIIEELVAEIQ